MGGVLVGAFHTDAAAAPGGGAAAEARTGRDGTFSLRVKPGRYELEVQRAPALVRCDKVAVAALGGTRHNVLITCDSGIR
jgi:hypothetical protein